MLKTPFRLAVLTVGLLVLAPSGEPRLSAQAPPYTERAVDEAGLTITCEVFCSDTKLRTANARIRWHATKKGPETASLSTAKHSLQTTVFPEGFEKDLYVTVPVGRDAPGQKPVAAAALAQYKRTLRAYQFQVIEVERPRTTEVGTTEVGVVVEDLEPGMNYSWRVLVEAGTLRMTSPVVMCQAPVCPADMVEPPRPRPR